MPRCVVTSNVKWAVSSVHPQFCANVLGLSLELCCPVMVDLMLIHAPFSFPFLWNSVCRCNPQVGLQSSTKLASQISILSDKMLATCMDRYGMRVFKPINPTLVMKRLSNASSCSCDQPALLVVAASWVPNKASWGSQRGALEVAIKFSQCLYSLGVVRWLVKTDETPWIVRGILRYFSRVSLFSITQWSSSDVSCKRNLGVSFTTVPCIRIFMGQS